MENPYTNLVHLELKRFFASTKFLSPKPPKNLKPMYELLTQEGFSARGLILRSNVEIICTTDDPVDTLEYHKAIREDESFPVKVYPTFRPDKALNINLDSFSGYIRALEKAAGTSITSVADLKKALDKRLSFFHENGCRISDHALETTIYQEAADDVIEKIFRKAMAGQSVTSLETEQYKTHLLVFLGREYAKRGWAMQLHMGTIRNNNTRMFKV